MTLELTITLILALCLSAGRAHGQAGMLLDPTVGPQPATGFRVAVATAPITADFSFSPSSGAWPLTVQFVDLTQGGPGSWAWNFGDGGTSISQNPVHTFNSANTFTISLTATGPGGSSATNHSITVTNSPTWVAGYGSNSTEFGAAVAVDSGGNIILAGQFFSASFTFGGTLLTNASANGDIFLAKFDSSRNLIWSRRMGGTGADGVNAIALDASDNIYIGGNFNGTTDLGGGPIPTLGGLDIYVAKYNSSGTFQWAKTFGSTGNDFLYGLAVDTNSVAVILTGQFTGPSITFGGSTLTGGQTYLAELAGSNGSHVWSQNFGSQSNSRGNGLRVAANEDIVLVGQFDGYLDLATNILQTPHSATTMTGTLDSLGSPSQDAFVGRFNSAGGLIWSKSWGGQFSDAATSVAIDGSANIWVLGTFMGNFTLCSSNMATAITSEVDSFIVKYTSAGACVWAASLQGVGGSQGTAGVATDSSGNGIITGVFNTASLNVSGTPLSRVSTGGTDTYVAKYNSGGAVQWAKAFGGNATVSSDAIAVDSTARSIVTGMFSGSAVFGTVQLNSAGAGDIFIVRLDP